MSERQAAADAGRFDVCVPDAHGRCQTCSDEALPLLVVAVDREAALAQVAANGALSEVDISLIDGVQSGQVLLVHAGVALARLEEGDEQPGRL